MSKLDNLKSAINNPPPERLAKIEYRSHLYNGLGISFVCLMLIIKGFWYIIFAFVFGVGISYSQGMTALQKYKMIMKMKGKENIEEFENDVSPTRRRSKIIESVLPKSNLVSIVIAVLFAVYIIDPTLSRWQLIMLYPIMIFAGYILLYFFLTYWITYPIYRRRIGK